MNCGTILYDKEFQFSDGSTINKLAIVLAEYGKNLLVAKTTSKRYTRNDRQGCQSGDNPPNYFLPKGFAWFKSDTWIELDEAIELDEHILHYKIQDEVIIVHKDVLSKTLIQDILKCALLSNRIDLDYKDCIRRAYDKL